MNRGPRLRNRNVTINEEDEEDKIRKTESKKAMIRADFEKHKKEMKLNISDASKINEIKLKNQLEELLTANTRKRENMDRLEEYENNLERENLEATMFSQTVSKGNKNRYGDIETSQYLEIGFHPNRTTSDIFGMTENGEAEVLSQKKMELQETLNNIELLMEQEGEGLNVLLERLEEIKKNNFLLSKRRNDLKKMNDHADKRFFDLKRIDFLARTKEAATTSHLKELKDNITELHKQESTFKKQKEEDHQRETQYVINKQNEMADVLIELDQRKLELLAKQEELRKLELHYEEMKDKRKTTKIVTKYIHTFDALEAPKNNLATAHLQLKELLERQDSAKSIDLGRRGSPVSRNSSMKNSRFEDDRAAPMKRNSFAERNLYIDQIQNFYENHPEGPHRHVDKLIEQYADYCFREQSLNSNYEELQDYKAKKETELKMLKEELSKIKSKNEYITLGRTGSKIIERNEQEAIDSGMLKVNFEATTINQAKFEYENKRDADNFVMEYQATETFVLRCYLDAVEMMVRLCKVLNSIYVQSEHSSGGGFMTEELRDLARRMKIQINTMKKIKKIGKQAQAQPQQDPQSQSILDEPGLQRKQTNNTTVSGEDEGNGPLDLNEVYEMFQSIFEGHEERAPEFIAKLKSDVMILTFVSLEEIREYLVGYQQDFYMEQDVGRIIEGVENMRELAIENMVQKFDTIFKFYRELSGLSKQAIGEADDYLQSRGIAVSKGSLNHIHSRSPSNTEQMGFVKNALAKKWSSLKTKYDYDPMRDYRREKLEFEQPDQNSTPRQKAAADEGNDVNTANWDSEDLKAKISEIVGARTKKAKADLGGNGPKPVFRGKNEEDQKRLQMKKDKERQKQAIENMSDEDFLDYQRKHIKDSIKGEEIFEAHEDVFRKAQADQVSRLSQKVPIEELRRMIENSKVLSKIQILERKKGITDGKKDFKQNTVENYIPSDPKKLPRSSYISSSESKFRVNQSLFTPNHKTIPSRLNHGNSERTIESSDIEDSPKDMSFKGSTFKAASRFKPRDRPVLDVNTEPTLDYGKPYTAGAQRLGTIEGFRRKEKLGEIVGNKMPFLSETTSPSYHGQEDYLKKNKLLINAIKKPSSVKNVKGSGGLPKLEKQGKKKLDGKVKKRNKNHMSQKLNEGESLNALLNLQTDPTFKMVYSPSFFATSFNNAGLMTDFNYKFDQFKFQAPSLLIAEKL